jgi:alpha-L-fucosidase
VIATTLCMAVCLGRKSDRRPGKAPNYLSEYAQLYQEDPRKANLEWFKEARFGLFMHYGVYSLLEAGEWVQLRHKPPIPVADYDTLKNKFTANNFDADFITDLAIAAGMKYINITARHHDSFRALLKTQI